MGVFNHIETDRPCPTCKQPLEWQSKHLTYDGYLLANAMQVVSLSERVSGEMHTFCDTCKTFYDVEIAGGVPGPMKASEPLNRFPR